MELRVHTQSHGGVVLLIALGVGGAIACLLILTGARKFLALREFGEAIENYRIVPSILVVPAAIGIAVSEIAIGAWLLVDPTSSSVPWAAAGALLAVFAVAMAMNLLRGRRFDCGCAAGLLQAEDNPSLISWERVALDGVVALALGVIAAFVIPDRSVMPPALPRLFFMVGVAVASATVVAGWSAWRDGSTVLAVVRSDLGLQRRFTQSSTNSIPVLFSGSSAAHDD